MRDSFISSVHDQKFIPPLFQVIRLAYYYYYSYYYVYHYFYLLLLVLLLSFSLFLFLLLLLFFFISFFSFFFLSFSFFFYFYLEQFKVGVVKLFTMKIQTQKFLVSIHFAWKGLCN